MLWSQIGLPGDPHEKYKLGSTATALLLFARSCHSIFFSRATTEASPELK